MVQERTESPKVPSPRRVGKVLAIVQLIIAKQGFNHLILKYFLKRRRIIWWIQEKSVTLHPEIVNRL